LAKNKSLNALVALPMFFSTLPAGNKLPDIVRSVLENTATLPTPATWTVTLAPDPLMLTLDEPFVIAAPPDATIPVRAAPLPTKYVAITFPADWILPDALMPVVPSSSIAIYSVL
jgi:hypothetical protein